MMPRWPEAFPGFREPRVCDCGEHGFVGLTRGLVALCDPQDVPVLEGQVWHAVRNGRTFYAERADRVKGRVKMHAAILGASIPVIDHRSGDGLDNRRANLRECTHAENNRNARRHLSALAPYKGVCQRKRSSPRPYGARIKLDGKQVWLGSYATPEEAARAYDEAARRLHGDYARTNADLGLLPSEAA